VLTVRIGGRVASHTGGRGWRLLAEQTVSALVACFGNVLRGDDGFAAAVARELSQAPLPPGVRLLEVGIGGIHLVHELTPQVQLLVVVDALDLGRPPGRVVVQRPDVLDVWTLSSTERRDQLADMHFALPARALMLAGAMGLLPDETWVVGCQVENTETLERELTPSVLGAVLPAAAEVRRVLAEHGYRPV
jgi:hydrogenase maturation protease